jgi:hypothetical protein
VSGEPRGRGLLSDHDPQYLDYDTNEQSCERTVAELLIYSGDLDPDKITGKLKVDPTRLTKKGRLRTSKGGRKHLEPLNAWFLSTEAFVESKDIRHHLDWLLAAVEPCSDELLALQSVQGLQMVVQCIWWSASDGGGFSLLPQQMRKLADLKLALSFGLAFYGQKE